MSALLPLATLASSLLTAAVIFMLPEQAVRTRTALNLAAALVKLVLVIWMARGLIAGDVHAVEFPVLEGLSFVMRVDALGLTFAALSSLLWLFTTM
jgi:multicomponent Na+:H+ antiporter subunit D